MLITAHRSRGGIEHNEALIFPIALVGHIGEHMGVGKTHRKTCPFVGCTDAQTTVELVERGILVLIVVWHQGIVSLGVALFPIDAGLIEIELCLHCGVVRIVVVVIARMGRSVVEGELISI